MNLILYVGSPQLALLLVLILLWLVLIAFVFFSWQGFRIAKGDPWTSTSLKSMYVELIPFLFAELKYHRHRLGDRYEFLKAWLLISKNLYVYFYRIKKLALAKAFIQGWNKGMENSHRKGWEEGHRKGFLEGLTKGNIINYCKGSRVALKTGEEIGYIEGYNKGYSKGHTAGHTDGYAKGCRKRRRNAGNKKFNVLYKKITIARAWS